MPTLDELLTAYRHVRELQDFADRHREMVPLRHLQAGSVRINPLAIAQCAIEGALHKRLAPFGLAPFVWLELIVYWDVQSGQFEFAPMRSAHGIDVRAGAEPDGLEERDIHRG